MTIRNLWIVVSEAAITFAFGLFTWLKLGGIAGIIIAILFGICNLGMWTLGPGNSNLAGGALAGALLALLYTAMIAFLVQGCYEMGVDARRSYNNWKSAKLRKASNEPG